MEWIEIAKLISELGIFVIIAALFLYRSYRDSQNQEKMIEKIFNTAMEKINDANENRNTKPHVLTPEEDAYATKVGKGIDIYLQDIVKATESSRAMVARYHNGGSDMAAVPFLKMSVTNEILNVGYKPVAQDFQNQFRSMIGIVCEQIKEKGFSYIKDIEDIKALDLGTYEFLKGRHVRAMYSEALKNKNGYVIGFVCATYMEDNIHEVDIEQMQSILREKAQSISTLLCFRELNKR